MGRVLGTIFLELADSSVSSLGNIYFTKKAMGFLNKL